jgi:hypothetical protein
MVALRIRDADYGKSGAAGASKNSFYINYLRVGIYL